MNNNIGPKLNWLKNIPKRAGDLYFSLCESQGNAIYKNKFQAYVFDAGLTSIDFRLKNFFEMLDSMGETINFEEFINLMNLGGLLIERALVILEATEKVFKNRKAVKKIVNFFLMAFLLKSHMLIYVKLMIFN